MLRWLVPLSSIFLTLVVCEAAYRFHRYATLSKGETGNYLLLDRPLYQFEPRSGYRYLPNQTFTPHWMSESHQLIRTNQVRTNNQGYPMKQDVTEKKPQDEYRIAVLGDSLTACIHNNIPWPEVFEQELNQDSKLLRHLGKRRVRVINFARDGIALEQFAPIAENEIKLFEPDVVLVNFITADIYRKFVWRRVVSLPNSAFPYETVLNCATLPAELSNPDCAFAGVLILPQGSLISQGKLAEIKKELSKRFVERLNWFHPYPELLSFISQGKLENVLGRNPYEPANLNIEGRENGVRRSAESLRRIRRNFPQTYFLHLPVYWELVYQSVPNLAQELIAQVPELAVQPMLSYMPAVRDRSEVDPWINYPHDMHFSDLGAKLYGNAVYRYFKEKAVQSEKVSLNAQSGR